MPKLNGRCAIWIFLAVSPGLATLSMTSATPASAVSSVPTPPYTECPAIGSSPSCEILLVVNADNSVSVLGDPSVGPFDGNDDTLVGIVNNSAAPVGAVTVSGPGSGLSEFDGDGICSGDYGTWTGSDGCPYGPTGYEGPGTSFVTNQSLPDSAEVDFADGLQPGAAAYFSLEGALTSAELTAREGQLMTDHYVINTEAWIPQAQVVDPYFPLGVASYLSTLSPLDEAFDPNCYTPPLSRVLTTLVSSTYRGDDHIPFGGGYRLRTEVSFDYDPSTSTISNFVQDAVPAFGTSHRDKVYFSLGSSDSVLATCTVAGNTTNTQVAQLDSPTSFHLGYQGGNPLARPYAPPATGAISGVIASDGSLTLSYTTTQFPSHGIQVTVNGVVVGTDIENDASCLGTSGVLGLSGLFHLSYGLTHTESGTVVVEPTGDTSVSHPTPLC